MAGVEVSRGCWSHQGNESHQGGTVPDPSSSDQYQVLNIKIHRIIISQGYRDIGLGIN